MSLYVFLTDFHSVRWYDQTDKYFCMMTLFYNADSGFVSDLIYSISEYHFFAAI